MTTTRSHLSSVHTVHPSPKGSEECLKLGVARVQLRLCRTCGHVGCCDDLPLRHATKPLEAAGHPHHRGLRPARGLGLVLHRPLMIDPAGDTTPQAGPIPRYDQPFRGTAPGGLRLDLTFAGGVEHAGVRDSSCSTSPSDHDGRFRAQPCIRWSRAGAVVQRGQPVNLLAAQ